MLKQALIFLIAMTICLVMFVAAEKVLSPTFQNCLEQTTNPQENVAAPVASYAYCSANFINDHNPGITAFATLLIAAFTATLWAATNRQALLTKEALIGNNRAFVFVPNFTQFWEHDDKSGQYNWRLRPVLRNSGNTPTKNMTMYVECEIRNRPLQMGYAFTPEIENTARAVIAPNLDIQGGIVPRSPAAAITPQDIIDVQNLRKYIYLWGVIRYSDVFPRTRPHITRYCFMITFTGDPFQFVPNTPGQPPTPGTLAFQMIHHAENNCIDEGCQPERLLRRSRR
jgi:hypothetical protein